MHLDCKKGCNLMSGQGHMLKSGGKFSQANKMPFSELFRAQRASRSKGLPYGMQEIGPENLLNKHVDKDKDRMSKIMARAETLKKIHRQRTSKQRELLESSENNENNDDILDDDYL